MTHTIVTIFSAYFPILYYTLVLPLYTSTNQNLIAYWMQHNSYPGIAGQLGTNSFLITLGIAIVLANIFSEESKKSKLQVLFLLIMIYALFLTGKRGLIIGNIIAALSTWYAGPLSFKRTRVFKIFFVFVMLVAMLYIISGLIPTLEQTLGRYWNNWDNADLSSGRFELYKDALHLFKENYLVGSGINTYTLLSNNDVDTSIGAHNDFLQIIVETGMFGVTVFFLPVILILIKTCKVIRFSYRNENRNKLVKYKPYLLASLYIQIVILFYSMVGNPFHYYNMLFVYMIFSAIPIGVELTIRKREDDR